MVSIYIRKNIFKIFFLIIFVIVYLIFLTYGYILPTKSRISPILLLGFITIIFGVFLFINTNHDKGNERLINFKILSENSIKITLMILMSMAIFISPISYYKSIILWEKVGILNYIRAYIFLIGIAFLPGASIINIFFSNNDLHEKFKAEPFLIKITIYPLLSFASLGVIVLILDQIGLVREYFEIFLFLVILGLFFIDFIIQMIRKEQATSLIEEFSISKYTLNILLISLGVLLISLGIHLGSLYLIPGDSWFGITSANFIGDSDINPIERRLKYGSSYPMFWGYICFGLSVLCGLPYLNVNALLAPFCYLFITSTYLLIKAILLEFEEKYAVFSTILISFFSGFSYITSNLEDLGTSGLIFVCEFSFSYKTYAYYLFFFALALFIINSRTLIQNNNHKRKIFETDVMRLLILAAFFLIISFMSYMLPLLMGTVFIIFYCLLSGNKEKDLHYLSLFLFILVALFVIFDMITFFFLSSSILNLLAVFLNNKFYSEFYNIFPSYFLVYPILIGLVSISFIIKSIYSKYLKERDNWFSNFKFDHRVLFKRIYLIFTIFLVIEAIGILIERVFLNHRLNEKIIFFYYIDKIIFSIGFIGIVAVYLSNFSFKKDKKLFLILLSWIISSFLIASIFIFIRWFESFSFFMRDIDDRNIFTMNHWFGRNWFYAIIPLCILSSIGLIDISENIKFHVKFKIILENKHIKNSLKYLGFTLLIYLSFSSVAISGMEVGDKNERVSDDEVEVIGWMAENLPVDSKVLLYDDDYIIYIGIRVTFSYRIKYIEDIFKSKYNYTELINEIEFLKENDIEYLIITEDYLSESSEEVYFVKTYLKPNFYNDTLYRSDEYKVYYAPYFD